MSDPQRPVGRTPPRAEPLQPDKPGSGDERLHDDDARSDDAQKKRAEQERSAVDNVRKGYD